MKGNRTYESMDFQKKRSLLAAVANLYYCSDLTQNEIAERLYISRPKVSRMLKEARELGIVEISIHEPWERNLDYEQRLRNAFGLENVRVVVSQNSGKEKEAEKIAEAVSYYLDSVVKPGMVLGISWGNTLYHIVKHISTNNRKNIPVTVVPIMGAANIKSPEKDAMDLAKDLASAYGGKYYYIYAPLFVKDKALRDNLVREANIQNVLELSARADIILTSVGSIVYKSWSDYLSKKTLETLEQKGAVGHMGGHFFDREGQELATSLAEKMIGIHLTDIRQCRDVVCAVCGESKAEAVLGALRGGLINTLIIDENCAGRVLDMLEK